MSIISFGNPQKFFNKKKYYKNYFTHNQIEKLIGSQGFKIINTFPGTFFVSETIIKKVYDKIFSNKLFQSSVFYILNKR